MRRYQLFEWEDQPWLPAVFRNFVTDHLHYKLGRPDRAPINRAIAARLARVLARTRARRIVDLCSGGGGPLLAVRRELGAALGRDVEIVLTDLYPNTAAFQRFEAEAQGRVRPRYAPTDALDVPAELDGVRTLFTALHHFPPAEALRILTDAVAKRQPIAVFEPLERRGPLIALATLDALMRGFLLTPFVGRMTLARFLLTYVLPLAPLVLAWDTLVSGLRMYSPDELRALADRAAAPDYEWEAGRFYSRGPFDYPLPTVYLVGTPVD